MLRFIQKSIALSQLAHMSPIITSKGAFSSLASLNLTQYDPSQTKFLDEGLMLVDRDDKIVGKISKVDAHLNSYNETGYAHRAFSVFLFNQQNQLLIHQRSDKKITFPRLWTNSCCSHPLYNEDEIIEENYNGARNAIRRRVHFELGHDLKDVNDLHFMGKIFYSAKCDETWGENEIDYCFFIKRDFKETDFKFNKDEIQNIKWVGKDEIMKYLATKYREQNEKVTPWFGAIMHYKLFDWWNVLIDGKIERYEASHQIVDLNNYQKPIFTEANGVMRSAIPLAAGEV